MAINDDVRLECNNKKCTTFNKKYSGNCTFMNLPPQTCSGFISYKEKGFDPEDILYEIFGVNNGRT